MLIVLFFILLLALKLAAIAVVYNTPPIIPLALIGAMIAIAYWLEPTAATPARPRARPKPESGS